MQTIPKRLHAQFSVGSIHIESSQLQCSPQQFRVDTNETHTPTSHNIHMMEVAFILIYSHSEEIALFTQVGSSKIRVSS